MPYKSRTHSPRREKIEWTIQAKDLNNKYLNKKVKSKHGVIENHNAVVHLIINHFLIFYGTQDLSQLLGMFCKMICIERDMIIHDGKETIKCPEYCFINI